MSRRSAELGRIKYISIRHDYSVMSSEAKVFDFRGLQCPLPVFETSKAIKQINIGETILVMANDPAAKPDLQAWSKRTGHEIVNLEEKEDFVSFTIKRSH